MARRRAKVKLNIPMFTACILLCLTLFSVNLCSGLYAKYTTSSEGDDSARVIGFGKLSVAESGDVRDGMVYVLPGVDLTKKVTVSFTGSESATYVFVELTLEKWTQQGNEYSFAVSVGGLTTLNWGVNSDWKFVEKSGNKYIYYRELAPNSTLDSADVIADNGKITVSAALTREMLESLSGLELDIRAYAVQAGGFANAAAAWASVKTK